MRKILIIPNSIDLLGSVLEKDITGVILPMKNLSVNRDITFSLEEIKTILNMTSKEISVSINKIMHNSDLKELEETLVALNKMNISKIFFYDLAVLNICKRLGIKKDLVIYQEHLNTSIYSNHFWQKNGVKYAVISNDITKEEINEISSSMPLMLISYGYIPIFYSRRYLITNYLNYIQAKKEQGHYYIKNKEDKYPIVEEEYGTTIYTKEPINLMNEIENIQVEYFILNSTLIEREEFLSTLDSYLKEEKDTKKHYTGFLNEKTIYRVGDKNQ